MSRKLPTFEYFRPDSLQGAIRILKKYEHRICPVAGGTDLLIAMKEKGAVWENILDLKDIPDYDLIREVEDGIEIGALATIRSIETSPLVREKLPLLASAAGTIGSVQIRNKATIGGNLCNAAPSADTAPALLCLRAEGEIIDEQGIRRIPLEEFFEGPGKTVLRDTALLNKIFIPFLPLNSASIYYKESPRRAMDLAVVGVSCLITADSAKKKCVDCRIALGAVAPTPMRAKKAEKLVSNREITEEEITAAGETASRECSPISDVRGSAQFRREMVNILVKKGLRELWSEIRS